MAQFSSRSLVMLITASAIVVLCSAATEEPTKEPTEEPLPCPTDNSFDTTYEDVSITKFQLFSTHNSYHQVPEENALPTDGFNHKPLDEQLNNGVRGLEIDIVPCDYGNNNYRSPTTGRCTNWDVLHIPIFDEQTSCNTLIDCFNLIINWSKIYRLNHFPLIIKLELKLDWVNYNDIIDVQQVLLSQFEQKYISDTDPSFSYHSECFNNNPYGPIYRYTDWVAAGSTWANVKLEDLRGEIITYFTRASTNDILDFVDASSGSISTVNGWPVDLQIFPSCRASHAEDNINNNNDYCAIVGIDDPDRIDTIADINNKYLFETNVDFNLYQRTGLFFQFNNNNDQFPSTVINSQSGIVQSFDLWVAQESFNALDAANQGIGNNPFTCNGVSGVPVGQLDGRIYDCDIYFLSLVTGQSTAPLTFGIMAQYRALNGITKQYLETVQELTNVVTFFAVALGVGVTQNVFMSTLPYDQQFNYETFPVTNNINGIINAKSNVLSTDYTFAPNGDGLSYRFSIGCDDEDAAFRLQGQCLNIVKAFDPVYQGCNGNNNQCDGGVPIDYIIGLE